MADLPGNAADTDAPDRYSGRPRVLAEAVPQAMYVGHRTVNQRPWDDDLLRTWRLASDGGTRDIGGPPP